MIFFIILIIVVNLRAMEDNYEPIVSSQDLKEWIDNRDSAAIDYKLFKECKHKSINRRQEFLKDIDLEQGLKKAQENVVLVHKEINRSSRKMQGVKCLIDLGLSIGSFGAAAYGAAPGVEWPIYCIYFGVFNLISAAFDFTVFADTTPKSEEIESNLRILSEWKKGNRVRCIDN